MKKFEVGKSYINKAITIEVVKRTDKTLFFKEFNCFQVPDEKIHRKKIGIKDDCENINLGDHWSSLHIFAKDEVEK